MSINGGRYAEVLFPKSGRTVAMDGADARITCEVESLQWSNDGALSDQQLAFLGAQVECLSELEVINQKRRVATLSPSVADVVQRRDVGRAVWLIKERLYWRQPRAAAVLLLALRELMPTSKYWFVKDDAVLLTQ